MHQRIATQPETLPKHPNALRAITQATIALKLYHNDRSIPIPTPPISLPELIHQLNEAYNELLKCQEQITFH